jgi:hypothetical protein
MAADGWHDPRYSKGVRDTAQIIASWNRRVDEEGPDALVQLPEPVNKFPE